MHITDSLIKSAYSFTVCKKAEKPISTQSATKSNEGILLIHIMQDLSIAQQSAPSAQNSNSSQYQFSRMNAPRWLSPFRAFTSRPPSGSEARRRRIASNVSTAAIVKKMPAWLNRFSILL